MKKYLVLIFGILFSNSSCKQNEINDFDKRKLAQLEANQKVIKALLNAGDKLIASREVFHWIYFKNEDEKNDYVKEVAQEGFEVVSSNVIDDKFPYQLQIKRIDKVDENSVNKYVIYLWETSLKCNGDYDGWETSIEK